MDDALSACLKYLFTYSHMQQGNFNSSVGPDGYMLSAVTCGMSPVTSITEGLQQVKLAHGARLHSQSIFELYVTTSRPMCCSDRHHGAVPHHRSLLSGELRQYRATLHDSEGAVESGGQEGIALQPPPCPTCTSAQLW